MLTSALAAITTQVDHLTHGGLCRRPPFQPRPGLGLGRTPVLPSVPSSTPSHGMTCFTCLPNPPASHERRGCPLQSTTQWISPYPTQHWQRQQHAWTLVHCSWANAGPSCTPYTLAKHTHWPHLSSALIRPYFAGLQSHLARYHLSPGLMHQKFHHFKLKKYQLSAKSSATQAC